MNEIENILQGLSATEREAVIQILREQQLTGTSAALNSIVATDYDEIPVSMQEFISNPRYAGNYLQTYYDFWKEQLINIFDSGKHYSEIAFTGSIGTGKSSMAIVGMGYVLYQLMCLKNPQKYWGTNKTIFFAFFNNNLELARSVGFAAFHDLIKKSEWFLEHGEFRGKVNQVYYPYKDIQLLAGSLPSHVIGKDVFCVDGDTVINTNMGCHRIAYLAENKLTFKVKQCTPGGDIIWSENCHAIRSKYTNKVVVLHFENGGVITCTPEHLFIREQLDYVPAALIRPGDALHCPHHCTLNVTTVEYKELAIRIPVFDIVNAHTQHNFAIQLGDTMVFAHNCALQDELNFCLSADTQVYTSKGSKYIRDISPTDIIYGYNGNDVYAEISKGGLPTKYVNEYMEIELADGTILKCSMNHKFMLIDGTYKMAEELTEDDELLEYIPYGYVYITTNKLNGRRYIGQHRGLFDKNYLGSGDILSIAISKYGKDKFDVEVIDWAQDAQELNEKEAAWIMKYDAVNSAYFYNVAPTANPPDTANLIRMYKGDKRICAKPQDVEKYIDKGYKYGTGLGPANKGKLYIHKGDEILQINVSDKFKYEDMGWTIPRPNEGRVVINNGINLKYVELSEVQEYIDSGWELGNHINRNKAGNVWMTDGDVDICVGKEFIPKYERKGFRRGRNYYKSHMYVNKDGNYFMISCLDWPEYQKNGYNKGKGVSNARGTCWVKKGEELRRVPKSDKQLYLDAGWEPHSYFEGKCKIWHPGLCRFKNVEPEEVDSYLEKGWTYNPQTRCKGALAYENIKNSKSK